MADCHELLLHLQQLYQAFLDDGEMPEHMREVPISMLYKEKGERSDPSMYRPIALTNVAYRILSRAMAQRLGFVLRRVLGDPQVAFQLKRHSGENIDLLTEIIRFCEHDDADAGGVVMILDNSRAYDRVPDPASCE